MKRRICVFLAICFCALLLCACGVDHTFTTQKPDGYVFSVNEEIPLYCTDADCATGDGGKLIAKLVITEVTFEEIIVEEPTDPTNSATTTKTPDETVDNTTETQGETVDTNTTTETPDETVDNTTTTTRVTIHYTYTSFAENDMGLRIYWDDPQAKYNWDNLETSANTCWFDLSYPVEDGITFFIRHRNSLGYEVFGESIEVFAPYTTAEDAVQSTEPEQSTPSPRNLLTHAYASR